MDRTSEIRKVLVTTLALNIAVSGAKIIYGHLTFSIAIFSDGFHSLFDAMSNILGLIGIRLSSYPPDKDHPYGHRKYETVFTIFIGVFMIFSCFEIFKKVYESFTVKHETIVDTASFLVMAATMCVNIFVSAYEKKEGTRLKSEFLIADSRHTRSDIYVSLGVIASLVLVKLGVFFADAVTGAVVGVFVARAGLLIIKESTEVLVDATPTETAGICNVVCGIEGVVDCHDVRTRGTKNEIFIDLHVTVDPSISVGEAHRIADRVETELKDRFPEVADVMVHIEPSSVIY